MTCIIFPGLLFFPSGLCRWKWLCTEGGVFSRKKDWIRLPYPSTFPNTPCFLWGRGFVVTLPNRDVAPSPRQDLREARSRVYSTQLTRSIWSYCFGGHADCKVRRVAESTSACRQLIAAIMNAVLVFVFESVDFKLPLRNAHYPTESFCGYSAYDALVLLLFPQLSIISQSNFKGCFYYRPVKPGIFFTNTTSQSLNALD